ncbi:MAG TPA: hypothetical protein VN896_05400 [Methylomirabilota bacterium]|nr:hypothetical protein [Methylomirabilota bacterium]
MCRWMCDRLSAFGLESGTDSLRVEREEALPGGGARVLIQQLWHGLPVVGADARAIVGADGQLRSLLSGFKPNLAAPLAPQIAPERARSLAAGLRSPAFEATTLAIVRRASGDHLVWDVVQQLEGGERVRTRVDAVTGETLDEDAGAHAVGRVYPTDPRQPAEERELPGLLAVTPLRGRDFRIDDASYPLAIAAAPGDFRFAVGDPAFDQVNVYWHVDHYLHDFMGALGYGGSPDSVVVRVHFLADPDVARTNGSIVLLGIPIRGFCREPSWSHDVIYHELGHTVIYGFGVQPGGDNREGNALHEGIADYFAAAITGDPAIGEWAYITFPNGVTRLDRPCPPWDKAHYDQVAFGGGGPSSPWANGMILGSALWDLRLRIGASSDSLVLESLVYLPTWPTWAQFANAMYLADRDHHGGRFWPVIGEVLRRRGIRGAVSASISGPSRLSPGETGEFRALPCCGGTPGAYHWRVRGWCRGMPCESWRDVADGDRLTTAFTDDSEIELSVLSPFGDPDTTHAYVSVLAPTLEFEGPSNVAKNAFGTWKVRPTGAAPFRVFMYRKWLPPGYQEEILGQLTSVTFAAPMSFRLRAVLTDHAGRTAEAEREVEVFTDHPPKSSTSPVLLTQFMDAERRAEVHIELRDAANVRLKVFDIRGRERLVLVDEQEPRGERIVRWDTQVLEPGVYFLRATTSSGHGAKLRFIVLR